MGQEQGRLIATFYNPGPEQLITYTEAIPWILKLYLHTMKFTSTNEQLIAARLNPTKILYSPGKDRHRPTVLEIMIRLPPKSTTVFDVELEYAFLKVAEHYPDANYGFEIGSSILNFNSTRIYSDSALVRLPTPDFSMPYNVITLTCTVMALYFGGIFNILMRKWMPIKI